MTDREVLCVGYWEKLPKEGQPTNGAFWSGAAGSGTPLRGTKLPIAPVAENDR
ncbi:hypothetical protein [Sphingomonas sp. LH128]|uniref:hypothetical protein n=1 Tax=Sphingomonas sp. LH128 TaxID=473781 RepID=UPI0003152DE0|nr:hypothetical protein [Sphingomonas sp. LH128]